jgi:hypothetical protein
LSTLPSGGAPRTADRHVDGARRISLRVEPMTTSASAMLQSTGADRRMLPGTVAAANRCGDRPQVFA